MANIVNNPIILDKWSKNITRQISKEDWYKKLNEMDMMGYSI